MPALPALRMVVDIFRATSYSLDSHSRYPTYRERESRPPVSVRPIRMNTPLGLDAERRLGWSSSRRGFAPFETQPGLQPFRNRPLRAVASRPIRTPPTVHAILLAPLAARKDRLQTVPASPQRLLTPADTHYTRLLESMRWPLDNSAECGYKYSPAACDELHGRLETRRHGNLRNKTPMENRRLGLDLGRGDPCRRGIAHM